MAEKPFEGLKVADFTWWVAGPLTTKILADYGATVINIEQPTRPAGLRTSMPYPDNKPGANRSGFFAFYNANKYSLGLDLSRPEGVEVARKLIGWSDVVVENFVPGVMERWGLGYEDLKKIKPDIIMLRASNQGQTGPFSGLGGLGTSLNALAGFVHFTGWLDRDPLSLMFAYSDYFVPLFAISLLGAALDYRRRTGKGQMLDVAQSEICFQFIAPYILEYRINGNESQRRGNLHSHAAPHNAYPCKGDNRWCTVAVFNDNDWEAFCRVIDNPSRSKDPKFGTLLGRNI